MHCSSEQLMVAGEVGRLAGAAPERGNTDQLLDLLRSACRFEAASLVRWSADDGDHVGVGVANHRYDDDMFSTSLISSRPRSRPSVSTAAGFRCASMTRRTTFASPRLISSNCIHAGSTMV